MGVAAKVYISSEVEVNGAELVGVGVISKGMGSAAHAGWIW